MSELSVQAKKRKKEKKETPTAAFGFVFGAQKVKKVCLVLQ